MQFNTSPNAMNMITCGMDIVWMYDVQCIIIYVQYLDVAETGELES